MKTALILLLTFAGYSCAEDLTLPQQAQEVKKLVSVTWNVDSQKLVWKVQKGSIVNGKFVPNSEQTYEISPDNALMAVENQQRHFDTGEAESLSHMLDVLSLYCAESVEWWDEGQGVPVTPTGKPAAPSSPPRQLPPLKADPPAGGNSVSGKPVKVEQPQPKPPKRYQIPDGDEVAFLPYN